MRLVAHNYGQTNVILFLLYQILLGQSVKILFSILHL